MKNSFKMKFKNYTIKFNNKMKLHFNINNKY